MLIRSFLVCLFFCISAYADSDIVDKYKEKLSQIEFNDVSSIEIAADELIKFSKGQDESTREKLLFRFREYYYNVLREYNEQHEIGGFPIEDSEINKLNLSLSKAGWVVKDSEGYYYLGELAGWFESRFENILTPNYKEYFYLRSKDIRKGFSEDAGLMISWEQLRKRISTWDDFLSKYPNFVENHNIESYLEMYIATYLWGMDNSRIYEFETMRLKDEVKESYEKFIIENSNSRYFSLVKGFYEILSNDKFYLREKGMTYLEKRGYATMSGIQPPTY